MKHSLLHNLHSYFRLLGQHRFYTTVCVVGTAVTIAFIMVVVMVYDFRTANVASACVPMVPTCGATVGWDPPLSMLFWTHCPAWTSLPFMADSATPCVPCPPPLTGIP